MKKILMVAAILAFGFTTANAQYDPRYDRHDNQESYNSSPYSDGRHSEINFLQREARQRIDMGIRRRALAPREADALMREYRRIEVMEQRFSRRGHLSGKESKILRRELENLMAQTRRMSRGNDGWAHGRDRY